MPTQRFFVQAVSRAAAIAVALTRFTLLDVSAAEAVTPESQPTPPKSAPLTPQQRADALLESLILDGEPGAAVLVSRDGKIIYERAQGFANVERKQPITLQTQFRIGSVTKQFTAASILKLQEQGKLSVSDPLSKYFPDFPRGNEVTLRHLLTHTSGIHSYTDTPGFSQQVDKPESSTDLVAMIKGLGYDLNPGERWSYSNSGYFLLGVVVEKVSGLSYEEFVQRTFFQPLGMKDSGVYHNDRPPAGEATGYSYKDNAYQLAPKWDMSWAGGAGWLYSTVEDLNRWACALWNNQVLLPESLKAMTTPVVTEDTKNVKSEGGYGYGLGISRYRGALAISHGGGLPGFVSQVESLPEKKLVVVALVNALPPKPKLLATTLTRELIDIFAGDELAPRGETQSAVSISPEATAAIVGRYDAGMAFMDVTREGDHLFVKLGRQPRLEIFPKSETEFFLKAVDAQLTFEKDANGKVTRVINHQNGMNLPFARYEEPTAIQLPVEKLEPLVGQYRYGPNAILTITREGDQLSAQLTGQPKFEIFPQSETEFFWKVVAARATVVKDAQGKVTKLVHHQGGRTFDAPRVEP